MPTFCSEFPQIDSLRDSSKRNNRRNGGIAPYAKGESSPSSPSYSDSSDSHSSIKRQFQNKDNNISDSNKKSIVNSKENTNENAYNVIRNEREIGSVKSNNDYRDDLTNDTNGCVNSSLKRNANVNKVRSNNMDSVDSASQPHQSPQAHKLNSGVGRGGGGGSGSGGSGGGGSAGNDIMRDQYQNNDSNNKVISSSSSSSTGRSGSVSSPDGCYSVPTSPTSLSTPIIEALTAIKQKDSSNSVPTSPETGTQEILLRRNQNQNGVIRKCDAAGFRTSRSEDHLQHTQRDTLGAVVAIDIDEDMNSSLNTLLDTRQDSEDSQVMHIKITKTHTHT